MSKKVKENILFGLVIISGIFLFLDLIEYKLPISTSGGIEKSVFVLAAGIDKADSKDKSYKLTTIAETFSSTSTDQSTSGGKTEDIFTTEGKTIFQAIRNFNLFKSKSLDWAHIKYIIISEDVAKENILDVLDFFIRDHELRFNAKIVIVQDTSAESFIRSGKKIGHFLPDVLEGVFKNEKKTSISSNVDVVELIRILDDKYVDVYIPSIKILSRENDEPNFKKLEQDNKKEGNESNDNEKTLEGYLNKDKEENNEKKEESNSKEESGSNKSSDSQQSSGSSSEPQSQSNNTYYLALDGFAIFDGVKLIGFIEEIYARGLNWIKGNIKSSVIALDDVNGEEVSVEVLDSNVKTKIKFNNNRPEVTYDIELLTNLSEINAQIHMATEEKHKKIEDKQNEKVKEEIEAVIKYAQENAVDIFNLSDAIYKKYPKEWDKIKDDWKNVLRNMKIEINVSSKLGRTYHIRQTIRSGYGDSK